MSIWNHFIPIGSDPLKAKVKCRYCSWGGTQGVAANVTRCARHYKVMHTEETEHPRIEEASDTHQPKKRKMQIYHYADRAWQESQQEHALQKLMQFQVAHSIPFQALASAEFAAFTKVLRGDFKLIGRDAMCRRLQSTMVTHDAKLLEKLGTISCGALAIDGWGDHHHQCTLGAVLWDIFQGGRPILLKIEQLHCREYAKNVAKFITSCIDMVTEQGGKVVALLTDNANNMTNAIDIVNKEKSVLKLNCLAHTGIFHSPFAT